nr:prostatic spermine-binding protein isoform X2 [Crassostrea gigas]
MNCQMKHYILLHICRMGTFLTAFDNGYISKFSGKSLDEIACEDIYSNDDDDDDDDDDVGKERARKKKTGPKPSKLPTDIDVSDEHDGNDDDNDEDGDDHVGKERARK